MSTRDPRALIKELERTTPWETLLGNFRSYEGWLLEVRTPDGEPVLISHAASRAGIASSWTSPQFREVP